MSKEQALLQRIAARLGRTEPLREKPVRDAKGAPQFWKEYKLSTEEKIEKFTESWQALTGVVEVVESEADAINVLVKWLTDENIKQVIRWSHPELDTLGIDNALAESGVQVEIWGKDGHFDMRAVANNAEAGITSVDYAIADTGTLALFSSRDKARSVSLLPPVHISIFRAEQLVTRIGEVLSKADDMNLKEQLPAGINFITGPSRSADIENDLSIGVHGPKKVYALIIK